MTFVKSKSKFDNSQCSLEKEGQRCPNTWKKDEEYIWDTDGKKAYCCKHDDINSKVVKNSGGYGGGRGSMPLHRDVDDGLKACGAFDLTVVPAILRTVKQFKDNLSGEEITHLTYEKVFDAYVAIYLGKYPSGK